MAKPAYDAPTWVDELKQSYMAGSASMFVLHGNVSDTIGSQSDSAYIAEPLSDFLTRHLFGAYDLVLHYDVGGGLRAYSAGDPKRLTRMNSILKRILGETETLREPTQALRALDRLVSLLLVGQEHRALKTAILFDYADLICGADDRTGERLAIFLNWARSPVIRRVNLIFVLMTESLARLHPALVQSGYTKEIQLSLPNEEERLAFMQHRFPRQDEAARRLAVKSAGLTLSNLDSMLRILARDEKQTAPEDSENVVKEDADGAADASATAKIDPFNASDARIAAIKKDLMEGQCPGLIEFVQPSFDLDMVAGHTAAKERLINDARLIREGRLDAVPMGYLLCGPVGVGKTFLAMCYAGSVGIPCITIRNFRSKYVGETEANLERILTVVRELGPVAVIVDEADAALGNRGASGDSGTSARVFAQLASQMGNTQYRGKLIWFLLTCRPDLLPIDLKRQGRCEEHIPLFYPQTPDELREMFFAMAKKAKLKLPESALPDMSEVPPLSGADIEGVLMRARREALLRDQEIDEALLTEVLGNFHSVRNASHELQIIAAVLESTDQRYLPENLRKIFNDPKGYDQLTQKYRELKFHEDQGDMP